MSKKLPDFEALAKFYPSGSDAAQVRHEIGGSVDKDWYVNTCVIRVSKSLNYTNELIPADSGALKTRKGADGKWYGLSVRQFWRYMLKTYGKPLVYAEKDAKSGRIDRSKFSGPRGIIGFRVKGWDDARGHFTLWDGLDLVYGGESHDYFAISYEAALWEAGTVRVFAPEV